MRRDFRNHLLIQIEILRCVYPGRSPRVPMQIIVSKGSGLEGYRETPKNAHGFAKHQQRLLLQLVEKAGIA
jgi:hypothetical protein